MQWVNDISRITHKFTTGRDCSWCAWAWKKRLERGWSPLVFIVGKTHARNSWLRYRP